MNENLLPPIKGNGDHATVPLLDYLEMLRASDQALQEERDRRYAEVNVEKEKALKIKETADLAALQLAREIQTYKDEKANELREQINRERGLYATRDDMAAIQREYTLALKPLTEFVSQAQGKGAGATEGRLNISVIVQVLGLVIVIATLLLLNK
jgi:hypothetical protein